MTALIIGATGATGKDLVQVLLRDRHYTKVIVFVRRPIGITDRKLVEVFTDFDKLDEVAGFIAGNIFFSCLGTTRKAAGSPHQQWHIDYEIPVKFAEIAKRNGVTTAVLLSSYGASAGSRLFYTQTKGKLEDRMAALGFNQYIIFRPGLLARTNTDRTGERLFVALLRIMNKVGIARKFRPLPTHTLAEKMAKAPKVLTAGQHVIALEKIPGL